MVSSVEWIFPFSNVSWEFGTWIVDGGGPIPPGTNVDVYENGVLIKAGVMELNFLGAVNVTPGAGTRAHIDVIQNAITSITHAAADYAMLATDDPVICDTVFGTTINITLPPPAAIVGKEIRIKNNGYGMVNLLPNAVGELVENGASFLINSPFEAIRLQTDGTNWYIL